MALNGISTSTYKADRQTAKLNLAKAKREGKVVADDGTITGSIDPTKPYYRQRNAYILAELPTVYSPGDNDTKDVTNNANVGGLITGRPWGGIPQNNLTLWLDPSYPNSYAGTGTTWYDLAAPANNVSLINNPTYSSNNGGYFTFNGSTQYANVSGSVVNSTAYTKSVWFYLNGSLDNNLLSSDVGGHYMFFAGTNKLYCGHANWAGFPSNYPSTGTFNNNTWYHVALTFTTSTGMVLYKNGVQDSVYTTIKTAFTGDGTTRIGSYGNPGNMLNGRIAHVMIYDRALGAEEVLAIYYATKSRFGL